MQAQKTSVSGAAPTFAEPALDDTAPLGSTLIVRNDSAGSVTVTLTTHGQLPTGDDFPDKVYTVAAAGEAWIPVTLSTYRPADGGDPPVAFSAVTSVTAACVTL